MRIGRTGCIGSYRGHIERIQRKETDQQGRRPRAAQKAREDDGGGAGAHDGGREEREGKGRGLGWGLAAEGV